MVKYEVTQSLGFGCGGGSWWVCLYNECVGAWGGRRGGRGGELRVKVGERSEPLFFYTAVASVESSTASLYISSLIQSQSKISQQREFPRISPDVLNR